MRARQATANQTKAARPQSPRAGRKSSTRRIDRHPLGVRGFATRGRFAIMKTDSLRPNGRLVPRTRRHFLFLLLAVFVEKFAQALEELRTGEGSEMIGPIDHNDLQVRHTVLDVLDVFLERIILA